MIDDMIWWVVGAIICLVSITLVVMLAQGLIPWKKLSNFSFGGRLGALCKIGWAGFSVAVVWVWGWIFRFFVPVLMVLALWTVCFAFDYAFPNWARWYRAWHGPPVWLLSIVTFGVGLILILPIPSPYRERTAKVTSYAIGTIVGVILLLAPIAAPACEEEGTTCEQRVAAEKQVEEAKKAAVQARREYAAAPAVHDKCDQLRKPYRFQASRPTEPVNRDVQCSSLFWHEGHCIMVRLYKSSTDAGPFCHIPGRQDSLPNDVEYVWSAGAAFDGHYSLPPPRFTKFFAVRN